MRTIFPSRFVIAIALAALCAATPATAQTFSVLYSLPYNSGPFGGVVFDVSGNMYGTTSGGGTYNGGTVYELSPQAGGGWMETILHSFNNVNVADGCEPYAGLAIDSAGNLYGTTRACGSQGAGTVFELSPEGGGLWTETILHSFALDSTKDGMYPYSTLALDSAGNLYGTTLEGGAGHEGTVFEMIRGVNGWQERVVYNFEPDAQGDGGYEPYAGVILDAQGNLYGMTSGCPCSYVNRGTVFELKRTGGTFAEKVLHYFDPGGVDGLFPVASLVFDSKGNLYGTTSAGGTFGAGIAFELSPASSGNWREKILHNFSGTPTDGSDPVASLTFGPHGKLYGTTAGGGAEGYGTVFELMPAGNGAWSEIILYSFTHGNDGSSPSSPITFDPLGNLYSTALGAGANDGGNVFEITP